MISDRYKIYSKSDREKTINKTIDYLESQKVIMEKKSFESKEKLNKFSIENGLGDIDGFFVGNTVNPLMDNISVDITEILGSQINSNMPMPNIQNKNNGASQRYQQQYKLLENYESTYVDLSSKAYRKLKNS